MERQGGSVGKCRGPVSRRHVGRVRLETSLSFPQKTRAVMVVAHAVKYLLLGVGVPCIHICDQFAKAWNVWCMMMMKTSLRPTPVGRLPFVTPRGQQ